MVEVHNFARDMRFKSLCRTQTVVQRWILREMDGGSYIIGIAQWGECVHGSDCSGEGSSQAGTSDRTNDAEHFVILGLATKGLLEGQYRKVARGRRGLG